MTSTNSKLVLLLRNTLELYSLDNLRVSGKFVGSSDLVNPISLTASNNKIFVYDQDRDRCFHYIATFDSSGKYSSKKFIAEARCDLSATISASKVRFLCLIFIYPEFIEILEILFEFSKLFRKIRTILEVFVIKKGEPGFTTIQKTGKS